MRAVIVACVVYGVVGVRYVQERVLHARVMVRYGWACEVDEVR